jgi:hypothetical protein
MDELLIPRNGMADKTPLYLGAALFIGGLLLMQYPEWLATERGDQNVVRIIGGLCFLLFWGVMILLVRRLMDETPMLILDEEGYTDRTGSFPLEKFLWKDISEISGEKSNGKDIIYVDFVDNDAFNSRIQLEHKIGKDFQEIFYEAPVRIDPAKLKMDYEELLQHFKTYHTHSLNKA